MFFYVSKLVQVCYCWDIYKHKHGSATLCYMWRSYNIVRNVENPLAGLLLSKI